MTQDLYIYSGTEPSLYHFVRLEATVLRKHRGISAHCARVILTAAHDERAPMLTSGPPRC